MSTSPPPNAPLLTEQEVADYGPEFIDVVRRAASEVAAPLQAEIQHLRGQLGSVQREADHSFLTRMHGELDAAVPGWRELNHNEDFISWTRLPDAFSGQMRQQLMQEAWNSGDAHRVAAFFRSYLAEHGAPAAYGLTATQRQRRSSENLYTPSQIQRFYTECAAGKWRAREAERAALDADIQRAAGEGRIVPDPPR